MIQILSICKTFILKTSSAITSDTQYLPRKTYTVATISFPMKTQAKMLRHYLSLCPPPTTSADSEAPKPLIVVFLCSEIFQETWISSFPSAQDHQGMVLVQSRLNRGSARQKSGWNLTLKGNICMEIGYSRLKNSPSFVQIGKKLVNLSQGQEGGGVI